MDKEKFDLERWAIAENLSKNFRINGEGWDASDFEWAAHCLQMNGYRKASEVAREIFEVIEQEIKNHGICYAQRKIAELKKKYTESEDFIPAPPHTCQVEIPKYYESIINQVFPESENNNE